MTKLLLALGVVISEEMKIPKKNLKEEEKKKQLENKENKKFEKIKWVK